jgi:hypothetical protein
VELRAADTAAVQRIDDHPRASARSLRRSVVRSAGYRQASCRIVSLPEDGCRPPPSGRWASR